jgi:hypothetical protein
MPTGVLYYDAFGNMAAQISPDRARPQFTSQRPTPEEALNAITGYTAYFGTYTIDEKAQTVTHHVKGNLTPGGNNDGVRRFEFAPGERLIIYNDRGGNKLIWERLK